LHLGLLELHAANWLRHIQDVMQKHAGLLSGRDAGEQERCRCELNVIEQVLNVAQTTLVQQAWERGQALAVHGWIYALTDGLLQDLAMNASGPRDLAPGCRRALDAVSSRRDHAS
jgi:carbonic anhydrase